MIFLKKYPLLFLLALGVLVLFTVVAFLPTPHDYNHQDLLKRFVPPFFKDGSDFLYPLGTDHLGRDMLSRIMAGIKISYFIALSGTFVGAVIGTLLGFTAVRFRGIVDEIIMGMVDTQASLPFIIIAIALLSVIESSFLVIVVLLGVAGWEKYARLTRGLSLSAVTHGYARAVSSLGASQGRILFIHILPNISSALIVNMTLNFPGTMIAESSLSFLGLGIQPPLVSLGRLLGEGRVYLLTAWWVTVFPGIVIFISTLAMTIIGDWVRDRIGTE
ncbi:MAG TPA: peptide ABC transporter permease [Spirochaeta sp.]|nr:peptide ABC transporter permease [Spirochaeta sp.]